MGRLRQYTEAPYDDALGDQTKQFLDWVTTSINTLVGQNLTLQQGFAALNQPTVNPSTAQLVSAGSRPQSITTAFTFVPTSTGVTFYWDGTNGSQPLSIYRDDGTIVSPIVGNQTVSGLSPSTTYYFYPYYDETLGAVRWAVVSGVSIGTPGYAFTTKNILANQQQIMRNHIPLASGLAITGVTTTASGTGSQGSGGNGGGGGAFGTGGRLV